MLYNDNEKINLFVAINWLFKWLWWIIKL